MVESVSSKHYETSFPTSFVDNELHEGCCLERFGGVLTISFYTLGRLQMWLRGRYDIGHPQCPGTLEYAILICNSSV